MYERIPIEISQLINRQEICWVVVNSHEENLRESFHSHAQSQVNVYYFKEVKFSHFLRLIRDTNLMWFLSNKFQLPIQFYPQNVLRILPRKPS